MSIGPTYLGHLTFYLSYTLGFSYTLGLVYFRDGFGFGMIFQVVHKLAIKRENLGGL